MSAANRALNRAVDGYFVGASQALADFETRGAGLGQGLKSITDARSQMRHGDQLRSSAKCGLRRVLSPMD